MHIELSTTRFSPQATHETMSAPTVDIISAESRKDNAHHSSQLFDCTAGNTRNLGRILPRLEFEQPLVAIAQSSELFNQVTIA